MKVQIDGVTYAPIKQSSSDMSSIAGRYLHMSDDDMQILGWDRLIADIRSLSASVLSQDEVPSEPKGKKDK